MTKLEWCRANAPDALKGEDDATILEMMSDAYDREHKDAPKPLETFEFDDKEYEYDSELWQLTDLKNPEDYDTECTKTLKYVGPIIDGNIVGSVPEWPVLVGTFSGITDLVHIPTGLRKGGLFDAFEGCTSLNPTIEELQRFNEQLFSGSYSKFIFKNCGSSYITDISQDNVNAWEALAILFNKSEQEIKDVAKDTEYFSGRFREGRLQDMEEKQPNCSWALDRVNLSIITALVKKFKPVKPIILSTGGALVFDHASRSSDLPYEAQYVYDGIAIACQWRPVRIDDSIVHFIYLSDDFVVDNDDELLIKEYGRVLTNAVINTPYIAGENGTIETYGDCTIEVSNDCPIQASGTLTIKGSGVLHVVCKDSRQACIGTQTHTGMSFGRWEPGRDSALKEIIIDGLSVLCVSAVPNFSIGSYGTNQMPKITYRDGGRLICPESEGCRIMRLSGAEGLYGSTKRCKPAEYAIAPGEPYTTQ